MRISDIQTYNRKRKEKCRLEKWWSWFNREFSFWCPWLLLVITIGYCLTHNAK